MSGTDFRKVVGPLRQTCRMLMCLRSKPSTWKTWCKGFHSPPPTGRPMPKESLSSGYLPQKLPLNFSAEYSVICCGTSFWSAGVSCPALCPPNPWGAEREENWALMLSSHCSATAKAVEHYQHCLSHKAKIQPHMGCCEDDWLRPSQTQYGTLQIISST